MRKGRSNLGSRTRPARSSTVLVLAWLCSTLWVQAGIASPRTPPLQVDPLGFPDAIYHDGLAPVRIGEKYGYIDRSGRVVIPPRFQFARGFSEGLARVEVEDRYGYIDRTGRFVIQPRFHKAFKFSDGLARVCRPPEQRSFLLFRWIGWDDREAYPCGYIDRQGTLVIDYRYLPSHGFRNGFARVTTLDGRKGYIDHAGRFEPIDETAGPIETPEAVIDAMQSYVLAQQRFFIQHGRYSAQTSDLSDLPAGMAEANLESPARDFHGYLFSSVMSNGANRMDYGKDFVLVAFPARYLVSGQKSYAIGPKGIVIVGDSQGDPIYDAMQLSSWSPIAN